MGCVICIAYFSHDRNNTADIITSVPSSAIILSMQGMLFITLVYSIAVVGVYMHGFYSCLKELKLEQLLHNNYNN